MDLLKLESLLFYSSRKLTIGLLIGVGRVMILEVGCCVSIDEMMRCGCHYNGGQKVMKEGRFQYVCRNVCYTDYCNSLELSTHSPIVTDNPPYDISSKSLFMSWPLCRLPYIVSVNQKRISSKCDTG